VEVKPPNEDYPDSCFVEDPAIALPHALVIANPGAPSRQEEYKDLLEEYGLFYTKEEIFQLKGEEFLDGGDVMQVGNTYYIGLSSRTNQTGADRLISILES
jgi:dimethylargininase